MLALARDYPTFIALLTLCLLATSLAAAMLGGFRTSRRLNRPADGGLGAIESSVFAVFGLLVAFTFSAAIERFGARRVLILDESKAAQTAWDSIGLLPEPARGATRERLRTYLTNKLDAYAGLDSYEDLEQKLLGVAQQGKDLVAAATEACRQESGQPYVELVLPPLNELREISLARRAAIWQHPPTAIFVFLIGLALVCAFFAGFSLPLADGERRLHVICFALVLGAALYLILDLEFPRMGLLRVDGADAILRGVVERMR